MKTPILVWGAGAIGGTLAAAFARAGEEVVLVDNAAEHVDAINGHGLKIEGPIFEDTLDLPALLPKAVQGRFDRAFLCVKAHHTREAIETMSPHLSDDGYVVSAQNGLNECVIADVVGKQRTVGCFVNFGADYLSPGVVHYSGHGAVVVGELNGARSDRIVDIHRLMCRFEPNAVLSENIWGYLWGKLVYGALLFATALTDDSIADVLADHRYRPVLTRLGREVAAVAAASGVKTEAFDGFDPAAFASDASSERTQRSFDDMVAHNRRSLKSHSGIWRDLAVRKRRTEVDAQVLPVVEIGRDHSMPTPLTAALVAMIHDIEEGRRVLAAENLDELSMVAA